MKVFVYEVLSGGVKIGISTAPNAATALKNANLAFTRRTHSKIDCTCDYDDLTVRLMSNTTRTEAPVPRARRQSTATAELAVA